MDFSSISFICKLVILITNGVLEDFLYLNNPNKYHGRKDVKEYSGTDTTLYIVNRRVIVHKRRSKIIKKDKVFSVALDEIINLKYDDKGLVSKKGTLTIETKTQKIPFEGNVDDVNVICQEMQQILQITERIKAHHTK